MAESIDGGANQDDVCDWSVPKAVLLSKIVDEEDGYEVGQGPPGFGPAQMMAMLAAGALAAGAYYYMKQQNATEAEL